MKEFEKGQNEERKDERDHNGKYGRIRNKLVADKTEKHKFRNQENVENTRRDNTNSRMEKNRVEKGAV